MFFLLVVVLIFWAFLIIPPFAYYFLMIKKGKKPWNIAINTDYLPRVSLIVATYNEAAVICEKLKNIQKMDYPKDKLKVIIVDSNSTDGTLNVCKDFLTKNNFRYPITLISEQGRFGKSHALNTALKYADGEIVATSDADAFWEPNALRKAVSFLADPKVGAVTGKEEIINLQKSIHTMAEGLYRKFYYVMRLGESKIHSTLIFDGSLALYRRSAFIKFEDKAGYSDDIGTIIHILLNGYRCVFVPDAVFYDATAFSLKGKLLLKSRRAQHLIAGILYATRLKLLGKLPIPLAIILFNLYLHVLSPILLLGALLVTAIMYVTLFHLIWFLPVLFVPFVVIRKLRLFFVSYLTSNLALIIGLLQHAAGKKTKIWRKVDESRKSFDQEIKVAS